MEGVCSQEGEETQEQTGHSEQTEKPGLPPARNPMERYGNYTMSQFSAKDYAKIRQWVFNLSNIVPAEEREDRRLPQSVEEANTFGMVWFVEVMATEGYGVNLERDFGVNSQRAFRCQFATRCCQGWLMLQIRCH